MAHSEDLYQRAKTFQSQQNDVDRRLMIVTQSETSDNAVQKFDHSMESLRKLDVAQEYMELLTEVENLRSIEDPKTMPECTYTETPYAAPKHAVISKNLHKMLSSHTCGCKTSSTL